MKKYFFILLVLVLTATQLLPVYAADFNVTGQLRFDLIKSPSLVMDDLSVRGYMVGFDRVYDGELTFDDDMRFSLDIDDIEENSQLMVVADGTKDGVGYFGSATTVVTEKEMISGIIGNLLVDMHEIPVPEYETSNKDLLKVCWQGLEEFSVIGYEIYRSELFDDDWTSIGRSGQNAGKQVCYLDNTAELDVKYYYRIGALTSWNAGENKEVMVSEVMSKTSDGLMKEVGVVDVINQKLTKVIEVDQTVAANQNSSEKKYFGLVDETIDKIGRYIEGNGWSHEVFILVVLLVVLLLVILFFVVSVSLANVRSKGSGLWDKK